MRTFLYKSILLVLIYSFVGMMLMLAIMAYNKDSQPYKTIPQMTTGGIVGRIMTENFNKEGKRIFIQILRTAKKLKKSCLLVLPMQTINGAAVYYSDDAKFEIKLVSGKKFEKSDFASKENLALVSTERKKECYEVENKLYFKYGVTKYKVIGVYEKDKEIGTYPDCYLNLLSSGIAESEYGNFAFDSGNSSIKDFEEIWRIVEKNFDEATVQFVSLKEAEGSEYDNYSTGFMGMQALLLLTMALVLLSAFSVSQNWFIWHKKEIGVRSLCGAKKIQITSWVLIKHLILITLSYFIGVSLAVLFLWITKYLPVSSSVQLMFGTQINPSLLALCWVISVAIFESIILTLFFFRRNVGILESLR
ncbi:MAG: ABC transporter permease [Anaerovoracaceae bacterium]